MMNKKGFTLIELIATIALLAIIAVIAFVSINNVITKSKIENCKTLVSSISVAASEYASDNRYKSDFINRINDNEVIITAKELVDNNYLKGDIINPSNKSVIDASTISVHIYVNDDYTVRYVMVDSPEELNKCNLEPKAGTIVPDVTPYIDDGSDKTPPVITYSLEGGIYKGHKELTITAIDNESGIDYMMVEVYKNNELVSAKSNNRITTNTYTIELDKYDVWKVYTKVYDKAGNRNNQAPQTDDGRYYQEYEITGKPIYIYYHQNGGTISGKCAIGDASAGTCTAYNGWAANGTTYAYQICRVDTVCNLWNYNNSNYLNITRSGYGTKTHQQWKADGTGTIFSQTKDYTYEELKKAIYADKGEYYELNLRVNWFQLSTITCSDPIYNGSQQTIATCSGGTASNNKQTNSGNYTITCTGDNSHADAANKTCKILSPTATPTATPVYRPTNTPTSKPSGGGGGGGIWYQENR